MLSILKVIYEEYTLGISEKMINQDFLEDNAFFVGQAIFVITVLGIKREH